MKLLRFGPAGEEKPGVLDPQGGIRDLSALIPDITPDLLGPQALEALRAIDSMRLPLIDGDTRIGVPVDGVRKFIGIGLNYHDHAAESGLEAPKAPVLFPKWSSCLSGANDPIVPPPDAERLDWEAELAVVIGREARNVGEDEALAYVAGYCIANDVSERKYQFEGGGGQWGKGKGFDTFGPVGPYLVTADEIPDPQGLRLWLTVNGETMQEGNTAQMIFSCAQLVSHCSRVMTLEPGDIISTGTPAGVGMGMKPPRYLRSGDVVELGIAGLGRQRQVVR